MFAAPPPPQKKKRYFITFYMHIMFYKTYSLTHHFKFTDTDNFFEAFGLSDKPSTSRQEIKPAIAQHASPVSEVPHASVSSHGSGFWTETWGSFFDMKTPISPELESKKEISAESNLSDGSKKESTVLSQPHRASLFPNDSTQTFAQDIPKTDKNISVTVINISAENENIIKEYSQEVTDPLTISTDIEANKSNIVTQQPSNDLSSSKNEDKSLILISSAVDENVNKLRDSESQAEETYCDNTVNIDNSSKIMLLNENLDNVPKLMSVPNDNEVKAIDESAYLSVEIPTDSSNIGRKVESEYDVIEVSDSDISNNVMENSSDSFTRSTSVEVVTSVSQCSPFDISSSTIEIPDLPESMAENIVTWEWGTMENISSELYVTQSENPNFTDHREDSQALQMISSDSSFHTITASSFSDNHVWAKSEKSSHFMDESPNSSNEEQNSHHTDGSTNSSKDDDDTDTAEVKEYDAKSSSSCGSHATSSSSFVKCSVDDNDNSSHRGPSPVSTTTSERSDVTKHESEQNTSGDENETATSSDIEILSPPNGENGDRNSSPLKHIWLPRPLRLRRPESPTSDSSKDSLMPVVNELEEACYVGESKSPTALYCKGKFRIFSLHFTDKAELNVQSYKLIF